MIPVTANSALFCPTCASPSINYSLLDGGDAECASCKWTGPKKDCLTSPFEQTTGINDDELISKFERDVRNAIAKDLSLLVARVLSAWGFLHGNQALQGVLLGRYMRQVGKAVVLSILEERKKIESERVALQKEQFDAR